MPNLNFFAGSILFGFLMEVLQFFRQVFVKHDIARRSGNKAYAFVLFFAVNIFVRYINLNACLQINNLMEVCQHSFVNAAEAHAFAFGSFFHHGDVVRAQNHILGRYGNRFAVFRCQNVVNGKHQNSCFCLCFRGKRQMHCHLVTVEVGVECCTYQRMQLDCTAFGKDRLECLNTESVQRRCTVKEYRMFFNYFFQNVPNNIVGAFYHAFGVFDIGSLSALNKAFHYKRFKQFQCHFLRQAALVHFKFRAYNDNGTAGVVNTFTQKVLTETALFAFQHIGKGFQRAVARACYRTTAAAVVDKGVNCFLQHAFFVAYDNIRRIKFKQAF